MHGPERKTGKREEDPGTSSGTCNGGEQRLKVVSLDLGFLVFLCRA